MSVQEKPRSGNPARFLASLDGGAGLLIILITLAMAVFAFGLEVDGSGVAFDSENSPSAKSYQAFVRAFGTDEYILLAFEPGMEAAAPEFREKLRRVRSRISAMEGIVGVTDLDRLAMAGLPGYARFAGEWDPDMIRKMRDLLPGAGQLISADLQVAGVAVRIDNEALNGFVLEQQIGEMKTLIGKTFASGCHAAGIPVLRAAFERYNLISALIFGGVGLVFGSLAAYYLFKTVWAAALVAGSALVSLVWMLGFMGLAGIRVNLATGMSFGFVLIVSCTTVFHVLAVYLRNSGATSSKAALESTYNLILRPCFMCALTTAVGFLSLTLSPVPMVRQAGTVIGSGVLLAFGLALPITALTLPRLIPPAAARLNGADRLDQLLGWIKIPGFTHPGLTLTLGILVCLVLSLGIPRVQQVRHLSLPMVGHTPEARDMEFIRDRLSSGTSFSIVLTPKENGFARRDFWYRLSAFEAEVAAMEGVDGIDSLVRPIFHMALSTPQAGIRPEWVYQQLLRPGAQNMVSAFADDQSMRLQVHIRDRSSDQIEALLAEIHSLAGARLRLWAEVRLAGQMIYLRAQTSDLVESQLLSLGVALGTITLFMIVQLKSWTLGLMSLIPNLLPLVTIFGMMGWAGIALDPLTTFAAVISFGLSVDDSIHFLDAARAEAGHGRRRLSHGLERAYDRTARALLSTTGVLFMACCGLMLSPFSHVSSLGLLIGAASLAALFGDLMVLPALVRTLDPVHRPESCSG